MISNRMFVSDLIQVIKYGQPTEQPNKMMFMFHRQLWTLYRNSQRL